jgi:type 1 glutamine amidotransferase
MTNAPRLNALIVTGHDHFHHRWRAASAILCDRLEATGRFTVRITEEFRGATAATLAPYDVVLLNYYGADSPGEAERRWGDETERALFDFVADGRGLVATHSCFWTGMWGDANGDEFERMLGGVMRPGSRRVGDVGGFTVTVADPDDPITDGLPETFEQIRDDKYVNLTWHPDADVHVLATTYDDPNEYLGGAYYAVKGLPGPPLYDLSEVEKLEGVGRTHPVCWKNAYGDGRVFAISIGHVGATTREDAYASRDSGRYVGPTGAEAASSPDFVTLLTRGAEWAATGSVTLPYAAGFELTTEVA